MAWLESVTAELLSHVAGDGLAPLWRATPAADVPGRRRRDLLPLPLPDPHAASSLHLNWEALAVHGLNALFGVPTPPRGCTPTAAQSAVHGRVRAKVERKLRRLSAVPAPPEPAGAARKLAGLCASGSSQLRADACDFVVPSARVDVLGSLPPTVREQLGSADGLFPDATAQLASFPGMPKAQRVEYCRLVGRQLTAGKFQLALSVRGGGTVFAVGKSGGRQREVWHGTAVSEAAAPPPPPPCIASPAALVDLEASVDAPVLLSKKDAKCYFDQLRLPSHLRPFFGRPPVRLHELLHHAALMDGALEEACAPLMSELKVSWPALVKADPQVFPVSCCWPMGFSWSSFIAQSHLLACCRAAGLAESMALADNRPSPLDMHEVFSLATDDVMHFTQNDPQLSASRMRDLNRAMEDGDVVRNTAKDLVGARSGTAIGIDLDEGLYLAPHAEKLALVLSGAACLPRDLELSPSGMSALLGHYTWFGLLARPMLSCFAEVYHHTRLEGQHSERALTPRSVAELLAFVTLLPLCEADLQRPWSDLIGATDASVDFGFGACVADCSPDRSRELGRLAERRGDYVRLDRLLAGEDSDDEPERPRIGKPHRLGLPKRAFRTVLTCRKGYDGHAGALETSALVLFVKWLLRSTKRHAKRTVVLVDAKALVGAATKGRTSAVTTQREIRQLAALTLAGDLHMRYVYVPSEDNPADAPSRGRPSRARCRASRRLGVRSKFA